MSADEISAVPSTEPVHLTTPLSPYKLSAEAQARRLPDEDWLESTIKVPTREALNPCPSNLRYGTVNLRMMNLFMRTTTPKPAAANSNVF